MLTEPNLYIASFYRNNIYYPVFLWLAPQGSIIVRIRDCTAQKLSIYCLSCYRKCLLTHGLEANAREHAFSVRINNKCLTMKISAACAKMTFYNSGQKYKMPGNKSALGRTSWKSFASAHTQSLSRVRLWKPHGAMIRRLLRP